MPDENNLEAGVRGERLTAFLAACGWGEAECLAMPGDASRRRYHRVVLGSDTAVLMDAPPETGERVGPFLARARWLAARGFSVPAIFAADEAAGLVLMEDLGDGLLARLAADAPGDEADLYRAAGRALAHMQLFAPPAAFGRYDDAAMVAALAPLFSHVLAHLPVAEREAIATALGETLRQETPRADVFVHRDWHSENLLVLPGRVAPADIGILDFQDGQAGHPAYDLVSLIEDARRDVSAEAREAAVTGWLACTGFDRPGIERAMAVQGLQRNLRIVGTFARLAAESGKRRYLSLVPRVMGHVRRALAHPANAAVARALGERLETAPLVRQAMDEAAGVAGEAAGGAVS